MYLAIVALGLCLTYTFLFYLFPAFFEYARPRMERQSVRSIGVIAAFYLAVFALMLVVSHTNIELGNRILHTFGGGFLTFLICFLVVRDGKLPINRLQFVVLSLLMVVSLGALNEIVEFTLQTYTDLVFAEHINDTWLDLVSNTLGALIAALVLAPFISKKRV